MHDSVARVPRPLKMPTRRILRLWIAIGSIALFAALAYVAAGQTVPIVPDEVGYLAIARYMATGEALNLAATSNYSFGHAALLTPAFHRSANDPET